jgi:hypothetical protein
MKATINGGLAAAVIVLGLCVAVAASAQTTTTYATDVRNFEIISVDGNSLVVSDDLGTRELTVPADFRFNVDGKSLAVSDLKAGMKGTAVVTTTTTVRPVYVTTVKQGEVLSQVARSVVIREINGKTHRFTQTEADARNVKIFMDGKPVKISDLRTGDLLTVTIVTASAPEVLTAKEVEAVLVNPDAPVAEPHVETTVAADPQAPPAAVEAVPEAATVAETVESTAAATPEHTSPFEDLPKPYFKHPFFWLLVLIIVAAFFWAVGRRKVKKPLQ